MLINKSHTNKSPPNSPTKQQSLLSYEYSITFDKFVRSYAGMIFLLMPIINFGALLFVCKPLFKPINFLLFYLRFDSIYLIVSHFTLNNYLNNNYLKIKI